MNKTMLKLKLASLLVVPFLVGCVALITPRVESDLAELKSGEYSLDKSHTTVLFKIQHLGLSTYVGRFNQMDASLEFDPKAIAETKLDAIIEMASLDINDEDLAKDLRGRQWLNTDNFPQARFTTLSVEAIDDQSFEFTGELDWRGVRKPLVLKATFNGGANNILTGKYTLGFSASGSFLRSDFGMDAYIPLVGDEVTIEAYAEFQRN